MAADGDREFTFYRSTPAADELLSPKYINPETLSGASFANFGSIPLIKDPVRSAARRFAELADEMGAPVAFDVNLCQNLWESVEAARGAIESMLDLSGVVKLSHGELSTVLGVDDPQEAADVPLTRGASVVLDEAAVREAVRRSTAAGALACTDYGAMRALPTRERGWCGSWPPTASVGS